MHKMETILQKLEAQSKRIEKIEQQLREIPVTDKKISKKPFIHHFAEEISSIIGLKDAISSEFRCLQLAWILLLTGGISATIWFVYLSMMEYMGSTTLTKVELVRQPFYEYPPLSICPYSWINYSKVESSGLSIDGLHYSLGYSTDDFTLELNDSARAKADFLAYYRSRNFPNLLSFYEYVAQDVLVAETIREMADATSAVAYCPSCIDRGHRVEKRYISNQICYIFRMQPEDASRRTSSGAQTREIVMKTKYFQNDEPGNPTTYWAIGISRDENVDLIHDPSDSFLTLAAVSKSYLRVSVQKHVSLNRKERPCIEDTSDAKHDYLSIGCSALCIDQSITVTGIRAWTCAIRARPTVATPNVSATCSTGSKIGIEHI